MLRRVIGMLPGSEVQSLAVKQIQREPEEREPALSRASARRRFAEAMDRCNDAGQRVIVDLCSSAAWGMRVLLQRRAMILVPIAPDMTSVLTLKAVEDYLHGLSEQLRLPVQVRYVLSQFEPGLALHLDVRQTLERHWATGSCPLRSGARRRWPKRWPRR